MDSEKNSHELSRIFVSDEHLRDVEITSVKETTSNWLIELTEKTERVLRELLDKDPVLVGFCNTIDAFGY